MALIAKLMSISHLYSRVDFLEIQTRISGVWERLVSKERDFIFLAAILMSSLVSLLPFSRDTSISNFLVYALLPIILVFANKKKFERIPTPSFFGLVLAVGIIVGSFVFNWLTGIRSGNYVFGLSDYVILVCGVFSLFYSVEERMVQFGIALLVILRAATLSLSYASSALYDAVSGFFVWIVLTVSRMLISPSIEPGAIPGRIVIVNESSRFEIGIGWACAGLEELVITSSILYILVDSFNLGRTKTALWLAIGIAGSFIINIVRMVVLVWVAFDYGAEKMLWIHTHLGDILFLVWIAVFWVVFFKVSVPVSEGITKPQEEG